MLAEFITTNRAGIIARCQEKAHARLVAARSNVQLDDGVPMFLDQLVAELQRDTPMLNGAIIQSAVQHGHDLLAQGFTVSQVVHEYGDICQAVTEVAVERNAQISTDDFRRLNRCLDDAIAGAVTEYGRARDDTINRRANAEDQRLVALTTNLFGRHVVASIIWAAVAGAAFFLFVRSWWDRGIFQALRNDDDGGISKTTVAGHKPRPLQKD